MSQLIQIPQEVGAFLKTVVFRYAKYVEYVGERQKYLKELRKDRDFQEKRELNKRFKSALADAIKNENLSSLREAKTYFDKAQEISKKLEEKFKDRKEAIKQLNDTVKALDTQIIKSLPTINQFIQ
jgi:DNA-binding GntR family transcriptional regulator